jgi:ABC-type phosphate transport system substrate-binding protein
MRAFQLIRANGLRGWRGLAATMMVVACGACSFLLDRSTTQCQSDADCTKLGFHPYCQSGVCVDSHMGPVGQCFFGAPATTTELLNQCSTGYVPATAGGACLSFDDCARLGVCSGAVPPLIPPPPSSAAAADAGPGAQPDYPMCDTIADVGNGVVHITGSSNFPNVLQQMAPIIIQGTGSANVKPGPTPIFLTTNSCTAVKAVFSSLPADNNVMHDPPPGSPPAKYAQYYDKTGAAFPCLLGNAGVQVDVGESDVYSTTCDPTFVPGGNVVDVPGPIQAMAFVVAHYSSESSISREAAREVFGMGGNGDAAAPWNNPELYFVRNKNTGTQQMIGLEIGVSASAFWGIDQGSADAVHNSLIGANAQTVGDALHAIGIISVDVYDKDRTNVRVLAYKETDQDCAYLPDSTALSLDKQNVRDGHYPIWGPIHFYTLNPSSDQAGDFKGYVTGQDTLKGMLDAFIASSLVPPCAMGVQRTMGSELGPLIPFAASPSCACYFESHTKTSDQTPSLGCAKCEGDDDCVSPRRCSTLGYCETSTSGP